MPIAGSLQSWNAPFVPPARRKDMVEDELDGEAILSDPASGATHRLNESAWMIWRHCDGVADTGLLATHLSDRFEVEPELAIFHVEQMIVLFMETGLLQGGD